MRAPQALEGLQLLTASEAAALLGVTPTQVRAWGSAGMLRVIQTPTGQDRYSRAAVLELEALVPLVSCSECRP